MPGVITEQGFPFEDTNEGFKQVTKEEAEKINTMFDKNKNQGNNQQEKQK